MNFAQQLLVLAIRFYRRAISPLLSGLGSPLGLGCRFTPTCSAYALEAVQKRGAGPGALLAVRRVCRCHPWGGTGYDPVPGAEMKPSPMTFSRPSTAGRLWPGREPVVGTVPRQNS